MAQKGQLTTADYLPIDDFNRLVAGLHEDRQYVWELLCIISYGTALRISDVLQLKWKDLLASEILTVQEKKTGKIRKIKLNESLQSKVSELYRLMGKPDISEAVIKNPETGKPYSREHINRTLKMFRVKYRLNIKSFSTHTFRKTFGRYVYESSGKSAESLILLNSIFKHASLNTTKVYIGITQTEIDSVFDSLKIA